MKKKLLKMNPLSIIKRGHYFYFLFYWAYGLYYDIRLCGKSLNQTLFYEAPGAFPVQSISYIYLKELIKELKYNATDVFVDVGCAWGRLIGYLNIKTKIGTFVGVELNKDVAAFAQNIFCDDDHITIISGDICENIPPNGTIFYLFNPFDAVTLINFLDKIEKLIDHKIQLLYLHPIYKNVLERREKWVLIDEKNLRPKHMGNLKLCIYEYDPCHMCDSPAGESNPF